jgi:hypothetical protein
MGHDDDAASLRMSVLRWDGIVIARRPKADVAIQEMKRGAP